MRYVCLAAITALVAGSSFILSAQPYTLRAEIVCDACANLTSLLVSLEDNNRKPAGTYNVAPSGEIDLHGLASGSYILSVKRHGETIHSEAITLSPHSGTLSIYLPGESLIRAKQASESRSVSLAQLQHKVPKQARREFIRAEECLLAGDPQLSLRHLQRAVELDPEYLEAHNNLGSRYTAFGDHESALGSFRRAAELDPSSGMVQTNIAVSLMALRRFAEAETAARHALELPGENNKARYLLGLSLYAQQKHTPEMLTALQKSEEEFPNARIAMAALWARRGQFAEARQSLTSYLASGRPDRRTEIQALLSSIEKAQAASRVGTGGAGLR